MNRVGALHRIVENAHFHDRTLARVVGMTRANTDEDPNFCDADVGDPIWVSGPKHDRPDAFYSAQQGG